MRIRPPRDRGDWTVIAFRLVDGFIAHELQAILPKAVFGDKDAVDDKGQPVHQTVDKALVGQRINNRVWQGRWRWRSR